MLNTFFAHIYNMLTMVNAYVELHYLSEKTMEEKKRRKEEKKRNGGS